MRMTDKPTRTTQINIRVDDPLRTALTAYAHQRGMSLSEAARYLLRTVLEPLPVRIPGTAVETLDRDDEDDAAYWDGRATRAHSEEECD